MNAVRWLVLWCCLCPLGQGALAAGLFVSDGQRSRLDALRRPDAGDRHEARAEPRARVSRQQRADGGWHVNISDSAVSRHCRVDGDGDGPRRVHCR